MSKSLLLLSSRPEDKAFAAEIALACGLSMKTTPHAFEAAEILANEDIALTMADVTTQAQYQALEEAIQNSVGIFSEKVNANHFFFITSNELENSQYLIQSPFFGNFIMRNYGNTKAAGQHYGRLVKATLQERAFGVKQLLKENGKIQVVKIEWSTQKQDAVEAIRGYLLAAKFNSRMASVIANAVDELLMNAIFDAPTDDLGKPLYTNTARNTKIHLKDKQVVEMHVGYDGEHVIVSAVDHYGSLDKGKFLNHISKVYTTDEYKVKSASAGAGIGLATVFRTGGSFFFVAESHVMTQATILFRRTDNYKEFKDQFRFISTQFYL